MTDKPPVGFEPDGTASAPETTVFMLAIVAGLYRQKIGAEEDVHRPHRFFGT